MANQSISIDYLSNQAKIVKSRDVEFFVSEYVFPSGNEKSVEVEFKINLGSSMSNSNDIKIVNPGSTKDNDTINNRQPEQALETKKKQSSR